MSGSGVCALLKSQTYRGPLHFIAEEAKQAGGLISEWKIIHTRRERNNAAHKLAQLAMRSNSASVWRNEAPVCIQQIIAQHCNPMPAQ